MRLPVTLWAPGHLQGRPNRSTGGDIPHRIAPPGSAKQAGRLKGSFVAYRNDLIDHGADPGFPGTKPAPIPWIL